MNYNEYNIRYNFHIKLFHSGEKEYRQWSILSVHHQKRRVYMLLSKGKTLYLSESFGQSRSARNFSLLNLRRKDTGDYVSATGICGWHSISFASRVICLSVNLFHTLFIIEYLIAKLFNFSFFIE